ncbi:MAG: ATP synthase, F1 epsilon subunit, partial [Candidatus Kentron sp. G]
VLASRRGQKLRRVVHYSPYFCPHRALPVTFGQSCYNRASLRPGDFFTAPDFCIYLYHQMNRKHRPEKEEKTIHVDIVSAEGMIFTGPARMVIVPGIMGNIGVLPGHTPLLTQLKAGEIRVDLPERQEELLLYISGGFLEVQPSLITVLSDTALRADAIDEAAAAAAKRNAEGVMRQQNQSAFDYARARNELAQAAAQLQTLENLQKRAHGKRRRNRSTNHPR